MTFVPNETAELCRYRHEAFFYADPDEFFDQTLRFLREANAGSEPTLVVLAADKNQVLQRELRGDAEGVMFADMALLGSNPARIIPAWHDFLGRHSAPSHQVRGIGEPAWAGRSPAELAECHRHEALLNVAFRDPSFWLLCAYDTSSLPPTVIEQAHRTHPFVTQRGDSGASAHFPGTEHLVGPHDDPMPLPIDPFVLQFGQQQLRQVRQEVFDRCRRAGLPSTRSEEMVLAVNELATNSLLYGGGSGTLRIWSDGGALICETQDHGRFEDPLVGRQRPPADSMGGRGMWIVNQLCDLVQQRELTTGNFVRLHMWFGA
jgi:anti-sigma regulatory factor (Ser/Thr protein kinase)